MGVTYVQARLRRPDGRGPTRNVRGAIYSVLPEEIWRALRLRAGRQVEFTNRTSATVQRAVVPLRGGLSGPLEEWEMYVDNKNCFRPLGPRDGPHLFPRKA